MSDMKVRRAWAEAVDRADALTASRLGITGYGVAELVDEHGRVKMAVAFANLVTTAGDQYYAQKGVVGVGPAAPSAPTAVNGMKLGTGTTAAAKSGAGAALVTYISASNVAFNTGTASATAVTGTDTGWNANYQTVWAAGVATNAAITEVAIVNDQATNATTTAANTISRAVISSVNKAAGDTLTITWSHKLLGA